MHFSRFSAVREYDNHMLIRKRRGLKTSHMVSRTEFVRLLNESSTVDPFEFTQNFIKKQNEEGSKEMMEEVDDYDRFPDRGDYCKHNLDLNDPKVRADIEEKRRQIAAVLKKYEKEDKEKEKEKRRRKKKMEELDNDVSAVDHFPNGGYKHKLNLNDPEVRAEIIEKRNEVRYIINQWEKENKEKKRMNSDSSSSREAR